MDMNEVSKFEQKLGVIKLSEAIRICGYGDPWTYHGCALARAYKHVTGDALWDKRLRPRIGDETKEAARLFGVSEGVAAHVESMCMRGRSPSEIADWLASLGK